MQGDAPVEVVASSSLVIDRDSTVPRSYALDRAANDLTMQAIGAGVSTLSVGVVSPSVDVGGSASSSSSSVTALALTSLDKRVAEVKAGAAAAAAAASADAADALYL